MVGFNEEDTLGLNFPSAEVGDKRSTPIIKSTFIS